MTTTIDNLELRVRRYLLGNLPESEQLALETEFFADGNLLEQMQDIETDLVDEYIRGQLSNADQQQFERHYLTTPAHWERVAFAKELLRAANEQSSPQSVQPKESFWEKLLATLRAPQLAFGAALTAAVLLVAGIIWLKNQQTDWQRQIAKTEAERVAERQRLRELETQLAQQTERNAELNAELTKLNERLNAETNKPTSPSAIFSFLLIPGVRGGEQPTLKLPPGTQQIRLQMKLETDDFPRYRASLRPVDGGASWNQTSISKTGSTVSVTLPADKLRSGDYILTLTGVDATGTAEELNRYFFRLSK